MTGLLWDRVPIQFDEAPKEGQAFAYRTRRATRYQITDPIQTIRQIHKFRYVFSTLDVDYTLEVTNLV